jgi:hypothetical protein
MSTHQNWEGYDYEEEAYEEALLAIPYDFMASSDEDVVLPTTDNSHPYAEDLAYLEDLESLTDLNNDKEPPAKFKP